MRRLIISNARSAFLSLVTLVITCFGPGRSALLCKCPVMGGNILKIEKVMSVVNPAKNKKGAFQVYILASHKPKGTPKTLAAEKAVITIPIADALRSIGIISLIIESTSAPNKPPKAPAKTRAANKKWKLGAIPQAKVPNVNPM